LHHKFLVTVSDTKRNTSPQHHPLTPTMASWWCPSPSATLAVPTTATTTTTARRHSITSQFRIQTLTFPPSSCRHSTAAPPSLRFRVPCSNKTALPDSPALPPDEVDCVGTGQDVECLVNTEKTELETLSSSSSMPCLAEALWEWTVLVSPFFFWGTAMVAMKEVLPKYGPFFVSAFRLIPAGFLLVGFAASRGKSLPSGFNAWLSITLFALVDATCFQVLLRLLLYNTIQYKLKFDLLIVTRFSLLSS